MTQYSLFGAAVAEPALGDLDGLLVAGAQWVRSGSGARLSVVVADRWRADTLAADFERLGIAGPDAVVPAEAAGPPSAFAPPSAPHSRPTPSAGPAAPAGGCPADFRLGVGGLRAWAIAAGRTDEGGYLLATQTDDEPLHRIAGGQLARLGVTAVSLGRRGGPGWRVTSTRRLRRLVELLGPPPTADADWPTDRSPAPNDGSLAAD